MVGLSWLVAYQQYYTMIPMMLLLPVVRGETLGGEANGRGRVEVESRQDFTLSSCADIPSETTEVSGTVWVTGDIDCDTRKVSFPRKPSAGGSAVCVSLRYSYFFLKIGEDQKKQGNGVGSNESSLFFLYIPLCCCRCFCFYFFVHVDVCYEHSSDVRLSAQNSTLTW